MAAPVRSSGSRAWPIAFALVLATSGTFGVLALRPRTALETSIDSLERMLARGRELARDNGSERRIDYVFADVDGGPAWQVAGDGSASSAPEAGVQLQSLARDGKPVRRGRHAIAIAADGSLEPHEVVLLQREDGWDQRTTLTISSDGSIARSSWRRRRDGVHKAEEPSGALPQTAPVDSH